VINNEFYKDLGEGWYSENGDAISLLRREKETVTPWVIATLKKYHSLEDLRVLDGGCGGGLLSFPLVKVGANVTALDLTEEVLKVGRSRDPEGKVQWVPGDITALPFEAGSFDAVCLIDVLEHVEDSKRAVLEALRVLRPNGTFVFHTFNRTLMSWLFAAKGLDWFIKDSPKHIHEWRLFIKPQELDGWVREAGFETADWKGLHPKIFTRAFARLLLSRTVPRDFQFTMGGSLNMGYLGSARRKIST
jgi:2-polyprenyl-6-hydroxyphenyl methylase/3-demethylubiquinone-9 3-methyltransferase